MNAASVKQGKYRTLMVPLHGEIGAGTVIPFAPRHNKLIPVAIPAHMSDNDIGTVLVNGCSLEDEQIYTGDVLIFTKRFTKRQTLFESICIVHIIATGELIAKKIIPAANDMVTLRASGGNIKDTQYHKDDIEVKGLVIGYQRMLQKKTGT